MLVVNSKIYFKNIFIFLELFFYIFKPIFFIILLLYKFFKFIGCKLKNFISNTFTIKNLLVLIFLIMTGIWIRFSGIPEYILFLFFTDVNNLYIWLFTSIAILFIRLLIKGILEEVVEKFLNWLYNYLSIILILNHIIFQLFIFSSLYLFL